MARGRFPALVALSLVLCGLMSCGFGLDDGELLARARTHLQQGRDRAALIDVKNVLQRSPNNVEGRLLLGQLSLRFGDAESAAHELSLARDGGAAPDVVAVPLAEALYAQRAFELVLSETNPDSVTDPGSKRSLHRIRGSALLALGRAPAARTSFQAALALDPTDRAVLLGLAEAVYWVEGLAPALKTAERVLAAAPDDVPALLTVAGLYLRDRQFGVAEEKYAHAVKLATGGVQLAALAGLTDTRLAMGRIEAALESSARMVAIAPSNPASRLLRARALFLAGELDDSRQVLEEFLSRDGADPRARLLLGAVNYAQGNLEQADMYLASVVASDPGNVFARQLLAYTHLRQKKPQDAVADLAPSTEGADADPRALSAAGLVSLRAGEREAAVKLLDRSAAAAGDDNELLLEVAAGYLAAGQLESAARLLEKLPDSGQWADRRGFLLVRARMRQNDLEGARRLASDLASRASDKFEPQILAGSLLAAAGELAEARRYFQNARRLAPTHPSPLVHLGRLDLLENRPADAEQRFREAVRLQPAHPGASVALAQLALGRHEPEEGRRWLEQSAAANPGAVEPRVRLAQFHLAMRDFSRAEERAREALVLSPENALALNVLGLALSGAGQHADGIATLRRATNAAPDSATFRFNEARAHLLSANLEEAEAAVRGALKKDPRHVPSLALLASLVMERKDLSEAEGLLAQLRTLAPKDAGTLILEGDLQMRRSRYAAAADFYGRAAQLTASRVLALREHSARRQAGLKDSQAPLERWLKDNPNDTGVLVALAEGHRGDGAKNKAVQVYERARVVQPANPLILNNLAWLYYELGNAKALQTGARAFELAPTRTEIADTYGWLLIENGKRTDGIKVLEGLSAEARTAFPSVRVHLATAWAREGDAKRARVLLADLDEERMDPDTRRQAAELRRELGGEK